MKKKVDKKLMEMGEEMFWETFNAKEEAEQRYVVVDGEDGEIVIQSARLIKEKKKVRV